VRLLLDTHAFVWMCTDPDSLGRRARAAILDRSNELVLSAASVWEMSIKVGLERLRLNAPLTELLAAQARENDLRLLDVRAEHALGVQTLPPHHRDPFDRLLISQCVIEGLELVSADRTLDAYEIRRIW
jgi:PIN domain nuclease of toxin-antitoxin system